MRVCDTGPGFPEDFRPYAFEAFTRSDRNPDGEGSGLGLAIVRVVVEAHHGAVEISNEPHGGARVIIAIPDEVIAVGARLSC